MARDEENRWKLLGACYWREGVRDGWRIILRGEGGWMMETGGGGWIFDGIKSCGWIWFMGITGERLILKGL